MAETAVIGLGALNADRIYRVQKALADGETAIESAGVYAGGSSANTIYGLAKLGVAAGFCGAVGDDEAGRLLLDDFKRAGAVVSHIVIKPDIESGAAICISDGAARALYVAPGANSRLALMDLDLGHINRAGWLHLSSFVDDAQFELSQKVVGALGNTTRLSFSPGALYAARGMKALAPFMKRTDILFLNRRETEQLAGQGFEAGARACLAAGCGAVVVTLGQGVARAGRTAAAYIRDGDNAYWISGGRADAIEVADTTGAGDAFAAGFLFGMINGKDTRTCGEYGNAAARLSLRFCGARQGLPTRAQLIKEHARLYASK